MATTYELEGKIHLINEIQTFNSGFTKREFVVEVQDGKFPQMIKFECVKEKTSLTDGLQIGDMVNVSFDIRGNEYNGRYFVNLNAWKVDKAGQGAAGGQAGSPFPDDQSAPPSHLSEPPGGYGGEEKDDIPF